MSPKSIDLKSTVYELCRVDLGIVNILKELGFQE